MLLLGVKLYHLTALHQLFRLRLRGFESVLRERRPRAPNSRIVTFEPGIASFPYSIDVSSCNQVLSIPQLLSSSLAIHARIFSEFRRQLESVEPRQTLYLPAQPSNLTGLKPKSQASDHRLASPATLKPPAKTVHSHVCNPPKAKKSQLLIWRRHYVALLGYCRS